VARILPVMVAMYFLSGPLLMIAAYFQAIGDAGRAVILSLSKPYLFTLPLIGLFAVLFGERGIWYAAPVAELLLFGVTMLVLAGTVRRGLGPEVLAVSKENTK
jgi:Na+-driven multidrug efflux pump